VQPEDLLHQSHGRRGRYHHHGASGLSVYPKLVTALASMIAFGEFDIALASRILGVGALKGGMPLYNMYSIDFNGYSELIDQLQII